jgi:hypothetical protein
MLFKLAQTPPHTRERGVIIGVNRAEMHAKSMREDRASVKSEGLHFVRPPSILSFVLAAAWAAASRAVSTRYGEQET